MRSPQSITSGVFPVPGRRLAGLLAALVGLLGVAGCSGNSAGKPPAVLVNTGTSAPTGGAVAEPQSTLAAAPPSPSTTAPTPAALPTIGIRRGSAINGARVEVTLNSVVVDGAMMTVTWTARNVGKQPWRIADYFFAGSYFDAAGAASGLDPTVAKALAQVDGQADGVYVLDRTNARRYLTGRDKNGRCACSSGLSLATLDPGGEAVLEAQYQGPPPAVTTVDVVIPNAGSFRAVPVTR